MSLEALKKFKETVESARVTAVRIGNTQDISKILSASILHSVFLEMGKKSNINLSELEEKKYEFLKILLKKDLKENSDILENTLIKIDTEKIPVSELKYEKEGAILKIILSAQKNFDSSKIEIEKVKIPVDLLVLLDPKENEVEEILNTTPHKEVVKISQKEKSMGEKIYEIVSVIFPDFITNFKEAFWVLLENEDEFSENCLKTKRELLLGGLDQEKILEAKELLKGKTFWKILGRTLQRSEYEKDLGITWAFLASEDFTKTNQNENSILEIFTELKKLRGSKNFLTLLRESKKGEIKTIIGGSNTPKLKSLAENLGYSLSSSYFFTDSFKSFSEAEIKIRTEIRKVLQ